MIRIPYRYVLPLSAVMLTTALYFVGRLQQRGIEPGYWDGPPPRSIEIAMALNIPAGIAAIPVDLLFEFATGGFEHASRATWHEAAGILYIAAFVFGQWFLVGRWYDRRRGLLPSSSTIPVLRTSRIVHVVALVGSLLFICFGIWHMLHNGWTSTWITGAGIAAWGSIASIAVVPRLRWLFRSVGEDAPHQTR
jgi:hypothetical protein